MDVARYSPTDYLTMLERFVTNGDVFEFETNVQMDFPRAINYDPILLYLQRLMKDPLIQSRVLGSRLAGKVFYEVVGRFVLECLHDQKFINQMAGHRRADADGEDDGVVDAEEAGHVAVAPSAAGREIQ